MKNYLKLPREAAWLSRGSALDRWCRRTLLSTLSALYGEVTVTDGETTFTVGQPVADLAPLPVTIHDPSAYRYILLGGTTGAAEGYILKLWDTPDPVALVERVFSGTSGAYRKLDTGWATLSEALNSLLHLFARNSRRASLRNIRAHYDLGNDFFSLFLDETMAYSCACFERDDMSLREAQTAKFDRLCRKLDLRDSDHVIEIGTGWGGFAIHAAGRYGCRVTTTTISREQREEAIRRIAAAGLQDRIKVLNQDYRDLEGTYDKLVSIEMIEAVGDAYLREYFRVCGRLLKPHGMFGLQAITIPDWRTYGRRKRSSFINTYIFPGSSIPTVTAICDAVARGTDLRPVGLEDLTRHYVLTLAAWRQRYLASLDAVRTQGASEAFTRMWDFYLSFCQAGFARRWTGLVQMVFAKPDCRVDPAGWKTLADGAGTRAGPDDA